MTPDNPFLTALLADPDDDTLRLAMADWFEENGDPARAEFVRVQVELARGAADKARRRELEARQSELLFAHEARWVAPLVAALGCEPGRWGGWVFRRGFVEYFHVRGSVIYRRGERVARRTPVRELFLRPATENDLVAIGETRPWASQLTHLYAHGVQVDDRLAGHLADAPYFSNLRVLQLGQDGMSGPVRKRFRARFPFASLGHNF
jgi:uncharacterized protein (TIGR02996 family)